MDSVYVSLPVAELPRREVFRERVYCYELYHQLRVSLGDDFPYKLNGEVDKRSYSQIVPFVGAKKPDFIVHVPGLMKRNLVVMEVKPNTARPSYLRKDLATLRGFLDKAGYYRGVMLIYGNGRGALEESIRNVLKTQGANDGRMEYFWHSGPKKEPTKI
jgi:hypothetical protein